MKSAIFKVRYGLECAYASLCQIGRNRSITCKDIAI